MVIDRIALKKEQREYLLNLICSLERHNMSLRITQHKSQLLQIYPDQIDNVIKFLKDIIDKRSYPQALQDYINTQIRKIYIKLEYEELNIAQKVSYDFGSSPDTSVIVTKNRYRPYNDAYTAALPKLQVGGKSLSHPINYKFKVKKNRSII